MPTQLEKAKEHHHPGKSAGPLVIGKLQQTLGH